MLRLLLLATLTCSSLLAAAATILVKDREELDKAVRAAKPGDIIIMRNGEWKDVPILLECEGTAAKPIRLKAQSPGKVLITGQSSLRLGGKHIIVEGLYFHNGYSGKDPVISFRSSKEKIASHCRVTHTVINDYNNPGRMDENYWVAFYGKNNRLDHCSFIDKKNMGVLLAVILDDERSRENFHSIDHNYFGRRPPLGSNGGEIIRVGVSQHCQFNSHTRITDNFFEHCDGETEIVSIKSGSNLVQGNLFRECQGSVVLRHGDNNTVINNIFLGNGKKGTGGVRVINKGQWVVNNLFYNCRGTFFRSPLAVMNGIPHSPAHRYVQVQDAVIANNSFILCTPASFGEGSDTERTLPPVRVKLVNNLFYNRRDSTVILQSDDISGFSFSGNQVNRQVSQPLPAGFVKTSPGIQKSGNLVIPIAAGSPYRIPDSLQAIARKRLKAPLAGRVGFQDLALLKKIQANANNLTGASWFPKKTAPSRLKPALIKCKDATELYAALEKPGPLDIELTGNEYIFHKTIPVRTGITLRSRQQDFMNFHTVPRMTVLFEIMGGGSLQLEGLKLDGEDVKATHFIASDSTGPSGHLNMAIRNSHFRYFSREYGCENMIYVYKSSFADSIVITASHFENNRNHLLLMSGERNDKGYYNAEKISIGRNVFVNQQGRLLDIYRGGNDESTMGPDLQVHENVFDNCHTPDSSALFQLTGVQETEIFFNSFSSCNEQSVLIAYQDWVRAKHSLSRNVITRSGRVEENQFLVAEKNTIQ